MAKQRRRRRKKGWKMRLKFKGKPFFLAAIAFLALAFFGSHRFAPPVALRKYSVKSAVPAQAVRWPQFYGRGPEIVFVIDDMGHTTEYLSQLNQLGDQVTYSILPFLKHSHFFDEYSLQTGAEVILHLPLESIHGTIPGPGLITANMSDQDVLALLRRELASVPHARGANNHMGSKGTADERLMNLILGEFRKRDLFFLDSKTTARSMAAEAGRKFRTPVLTRDVFLDNVDNTEEIRRQVRLLAAVARRRGYAVGIGHYRFNTLQVLDEEIPELKKQGFQIVPVRRLLHLWRKNYP